MKWKPLAMFSFAALAFAFSTSRCASSPVEASPMPQPGWQTLKQQFVSGTSIRAALIKNSFIGLKLHSIENYGYLFVSESGDVFLDTGKAIRTYYRLKSGVLEEFRCPDPTAGPSRRVIDAGPILSDLFTEVRSGFANSDVYFRGSVQVHIVLPFEWAEGLELQLGVGNVNLNSDEPGIFGFGVVRPALAGTKVRGVITDGTLWSTRFGKLDFGQPIPHEELLFSDEPDPCLWRTLRFYVWPTKPTQVIEALADPGNHGLW